MSYFKHGFMTAKDLEDAEKHIDLDITPRVFKRICKTMQEGNQFYHSKYDFEYHKTIKGVRQRKYGGALP